MKNLLSLVFVSVTLVSCSHSGKWEAKGQAGHAYIESKEAVYISCFACDCLDYYEDHKDD